MAIGAPTTARSRILITETLLEPMLAALHVEAQFVRLIGPANAASGSLFDTRDRDALTTLGIDLDTVRERIEAAFGGGRPRARPRRDRPPRRSLGHAEGPQPDDDLGDSL